MVAAGSGERFANAARPAVSRGATTDAAPFAYKQFCALDGVPLVCRAARTAAEVADVVVVVLPGALMAGLPEESAPTESSPADSQAAEGASEIVAALRELGATIVAGGASRAASVREGLRALNQTVTQVVVHDAARPAAPAELFARTLAQLSCADGAVPGLAPTDTIKVVAATERATDVCQVVETLNRAQLMAIQTPQAFRRDVLQRAYERALGGAEPAAQPVARPAAQLPDCATLVELAGGNVVVVEGDSLAHKVTTPADLAILEALLAAQAGSS